MIDANRYILSIVFNVLYRCIIELKCTNCTNEALPSDIVRSPTNSAIPFTILLVIFMSIFSSNPKI